MVVTVDKNGNTTIDDRPYKSNESLRESFAQVYSFNPKIAIAIYADRRAPFETVTTIILLARTAGLTRVSLFVSPASKYQSGERAVLVDNLDLVLE